MRILILGLTALALSAGPALADAGHAHGGGIGQPGDPKKPARTINMTMNDDMRFAPAKITVRPGETIRFVVKNIGAVKHEMVLGSKTDLAAHAQMMQKFPDMEHDDPGAISVAPGQTGTLVWTFPTAKGAYDFGCLVPGHFDAGMIGQVEVR